MTSYPCPACGGDVVLCSCDALPEEDQRRLVDALQREFRSIDHAMDVACKTVDAHNLLHVAAMEYVYRNAPEDLRESFRSAFQKTFGVQADAYGANGERYFSLETVAGVLGVTVEEAREKALRWLGPDALNPRDDVTLVQ